VRPARPIPREIAKRFCVSFGFVKKLLGQRRHLGIFDNLYCRFGGKHAISPEKQEESAVSCKPRAANASTMPRHTGIGMFGRSSGR